MSFPKHAFRPVAGFAILALTVICSAGQTNVNSANLVDKSPEKALALRLIAAKDQGERERLLKGEPDLVTSQLATEIRNEGDRLKDKVPRAIRVDIYRLGLQVSEQIGDRNQIILALDSTGTAIEGKAEKLAAFQRAYALCDGTENEGLAAKLLIQISDVYLDAGELENSVVYAAKGMVVAEKEENRLLIAKAFNIFGIIREMKGDYVGSLENHEKALAIRRELNDQAGIAGSLNNTGLVYLDLSDYTKAAAIFEECISLSEKTGDSYNLALSLMNLGSVYLNTGDNAKAMNLYQRSLALDQKSGGDGVQQLTNIGLIYETQGDFDQATKYLERSRTAAEIAGWKQEVANASASLGRIEGAKGNYQEAIELQRKALAIYKEIGFKVEIANTLQSLGWILADQGEFAKAASSFKEALEVSDALGDLGTTFEILLETSRLQIRQGDYATARHTANRAQSFLDKTGGSFLQWDIYSILAQADHGLGQNVQAKANLEKSITLIENQRSMVAGGSGEQETSFGQMISPYFQMMEILVSERNADAALLYVERAKARTLLDAMQAGKVDIGKSMTETETKRERLLKNELTSLSAQISNVPQSEKADLSQRTDLEKQLQQKRLDFEDFRTRLYATHPELRVQRGEMKPITVEEAALLLPDTKWALVEFAVADDKMFLFVIVKDAAGKVSLSAFTVDITDRELGRRVEAYRSKLASGDLDFQKGSRELYDLVLKPARAQLAAKTNIIIVPDGPLWNLPFQALMDENGKFLAEKMAISYAPSLTALREMHKKAKEQTPSKDSELVAFGNPVVNKVTAARVGQVFMDEKLEPLPEAERLVNTLAKMYGPQRSKVYTGAAAREETAKSQAPKYRIVQFATHGILNDVSPMYSHLVLAQDEKDPNEDGLLEAWELKDLDLKADMVILSACDTARGKVSAGEGMIGMTWAAFIAGAPTTVASQWKVDSSSTTELMIEFHRQLLTGKVSKAEALRRAQLKLMHDPRYKHPSYWAGWVIVGDAS